MSSDPTTLVIVITGFGDRERYESGLEELMWKIKDRSSDIAVARFNWNDDTETINRWVGKFKMRWPDINLYIIGYSYGGASAVALTKIVKYTIDNLFLIDPVWRPYYYWPSFLSLFGRGTLTIPTNVKESWHWYQTRTWIRSCTVKIIGVGNTIYHGPILLNKKHAQIDSHPGIHNLILKEIT